MIRNLPDSLEERVDLVLRGELSPQKERIVRFVCDNPLAYTHRIAGVCAVSFPPNRIGELNREILPDFGLHIECLPPPKGLTNRFGQRTQVHRWKLVMLPGRRVV